MFLATSSSSSSSKQYITLGLMTSRTGVSSDLPAATPRTAISRSVIMPISRSLSRTGRQPQSSSAIMRAASRIDWPGSTTFTSPLIASFTCIGCPPCLATLIFRLMLRCAEPRRPSRRIGRNGDEPDPFRRLELQQRKSFALAARLVQRKLKFLGRAHSLPINLGDHIPHRETMHGGASVGLDPDNLDTPALGAGRRVARGSREPQTESRRRSIICLLPADPRLALDRKLSERDRNLLLPTAVPDAQLGGHAGPHIADLPGKILSIVDGLAVQRLDDVTSRDTGCRRRTVCLDLSDNRAACSFQVEALRHLGRDRLQLHSHPATGDEAVLPELRNDFLHRVGRNCECNPDRAAGRRDDHGVDANNLTVDVEGWAAG